MDGIKKYYKLLGALSFVIPAYAYGVNANIATVILLFSGNILGQIFFKEAYKE